MNNEELINLFQIPNIKVKVPTIWLLKNSMRDDYYNAHLMVRYKVIENFYKDNGRKWWNIYNEMQKTRVSQKTIIDSSKADNEEKFKKLILSFEQNGFNENYPIIVNKYFRLVDGSHRLALALYFKIPYVTIKIDSLSYNIDPEYSLSWFLENGFNYLEKVIIETYDKINKEWY